MPCELVAGAFVCTRGPWRRPGQRCEVCNQRLATLQCDYPVRVDRTEIRVEQYRDLVAAIATAKYTCSRFLCDSSACRRDEHVGGGVLDVCASHPAFPQKPAAVTA